MSKCIEFPNCRNKAGYGRVRVGPRMEYAHRVAYAEAHNLPLSELKGLCVRHRCDNPPCVNPAHLLLGTQADNMGDMVRKGRQHRGEARRRTVARGEAHGKSKFSDVQIQSVFDLRATGMTQDDISRRTGISQPHISKVLRGRYRRV